MVLNGKIFFCTLMYHLKRDRGHRHFNDAYYSTYFFFLEMHLRHWLLFIKKNNSITTAKKCEKGLIRKHFNLFWSKIYFKQKQFWFDFMEMLLLLIIWRGKEKHGKITGNATRLLQQSFMGYYYGKYWLKISLGKFYCKPLLNTSTSVKIGFIILYAHMLEDNQSDAAKHNCRSPAAQSLLCSIFT